MSDLFQQFELKENELTVGPYCLKIAQVRDWEALVDLVTEDEFSEDEQLPYWAEIWASAFGLANMLAQKQWPGKKTLELGAGTGLVSLALAAAGAEVMATDLISDALRFIEYQAKNNHLQVATQVLDWRKLDGWPSYDLVVAADVLYEKRHLEPVIEAMKTLISPSGEAWITDPFRFPADTFAETATKAGFSVEIEEEELTWNEVSTRLRHFHLKHQS